MSDVKAQKKSKGWFGWLKEIVSLIILVVIIGWAVDVWRSQSMASGQAPQLVVQSVSGEKIDLAIMSQERPVMVYFWATWCAVCSSVSPSVDFMAHHHQVVTIALNSGENERIQQYLNAKQYDFNVVNDPTAEITKTWGVAVTPTIFIVDKGQISSVTTGFTSPMGMWLRLLLA